MRWKWSLWSTNAIVREELFHSYPRTERSEGGLGVLYVPCPLRYRLPSIQIFSGVLSTHAMSFRSTTTVWGRQDAALRSDCYVWLPSSQTLHNRAYVAELEGGVQRGRQACSFFPHDWYTSS